MNRNAILLALAALGASAATAFGQATQQSKAEAAKLPAMSDAQRIAAAVLPLPPALRDGAGVVSQDVTTDATLRKSTNGFVCYGPHGGESTFDARCFHADVVPLFARAYELRGQKANVADADRQIEEEIKAGKLRLPKGPVVSYLMRGPAAAYDVATAHASPAIMSWQTIAAPRQTGAMLGLSDERIAGSKMPYVMGSGTLWAHIMVIQQ